jgi:hypothetical protein
MSELLERYHELMALRREALQKYRCNELTVIGGPPARAYLPLLESMRVVDRAPLARFARSLVRDAPGPIVIAEAGPGPGRLAGELKAEFGEKIRAYYGVELDPNVAGPYERIASIADAPQPVDLFIASEVAEHMPAERWYADFLHPLTIHGSPQAQALISVPNPVGPGTYVRDFSHVQPYPWYDLYAITRLVFAQAEIHRALYVWSLQRLATLLPRIALCSMIELDWCDNLICIASNPRRLKG